MLKVVHLENHDFQTFSVQLLHFKTRSRISNIVNKLFCQMYLKGYVS